ncbi:hypothetical protein O3M35_003693 [Rhynocoris fuscipes]|uniref:Uncharacterized protein n=1 Tax=Rhynocoris fuscipes TaxID=488301 RepID=A0AAW1CNU3_9HEMI
MNGTAGTALPAVSSNAATAASVVVVGGGDTTTSAITPTGSGPPVQNWRRVGSFRTHSGVNQIIGGATVGEPPSRRREEAAALLNLHKRVGTQGMTRTPVQTPSGYQQFPNHIVNRAANSNRPHLLLKDLPAFAGLDVNDSEI